MRQVFLLCFISFCLCSCGSSRKAIKAKKESSNLIVNSNTSENKYALANSIADYSKTYLGVSYKYGGNTRKGLDCSGLIHLAFKHEGVNIPRVSYDMAKRGSKITLQTANVGDLLFFKTTKSSKRINHVGLIVNSKRGDIEFIHSTSSKGVITSKLSEPYWNKAFIEVRRIL